MDNANGVVGFFGFFVLLALVGAAYAYFQHQQAQQVLQRVAQRFRGRVEGGDFFSNPQLRLKFQGAPALLKFVTVGENTWAFDIKKL